MKIQWLPEEFLSVISENNGLKQYLLSLTKRVEPTHRSWLYEDNSPDDVLDSWMRILSQLETSDNSFERNVFQFDTSQLEKWGPQGGHRPIGELMDIVESGFKRGDSPQPVAFRSKLWDQAKAEIRADFAKLNLSLRPASYRHVVDDMRARDTLESNSGWPLFTRRNKSEVINEAVVAATNGQWKTYPAIALFRNYNQKTRLVWMFPMSVNLVEGSFMQPLQSALIKRYKEGTLISKSLEMISPWIGFHEVILDVSETYDRKGSSIAASDFSETDAHFTWWHTQEVLDVIEVAFQPHYRDALRDSLKYMHEIPLIIGPDQEITGLHGVSSGSNYTNFVETVFDIIFAKYVELQSNYHGLYAIGDDMAWESSNYSDAFSEKLEQLGEEVGHIIRADKTTNYPDKVKSLQRLFQRGYTLEDGRIVRAVYSTIRALKSSVYPERFHSPRKWNSDMFCARQFMILENCVDHPLFEDFVKFICKGSIYLIPFAKKPRAELNRITRESKLIPGLNPTYNQEKRDSSLASFASIQIASKL